MKIAIPGLMASVLLALTPAYSSYSAESTSDASGKQAPQKTVAESAREIGQAVGRDAKAVGKAVKEEAKEVGAAARRGAKKVKAAVKAS